LNIVIALRSVISNALHSKISWHRSLQVLSHKQSLALVVAVVAPVAVAQVVAVVVTVLVAVAVVMVQAHALNLALVAAGAVAIVQATISKRVRLVLLTHVLRVQPIHALHALLTHVLRVQPIHVQQVHVLLNQSLAVNVGTLAVAKNGSPKSSPFFMESSRFR
jgi:hypothetical protein